MKIRTGFVSNSSSSSFVLITTKANHERALMNLQPYICKVASAVMEEQSFAGMPVMVVGDINVMDSGYYMFEDIESPDEDNPTIVHTRYGQHEIESARDAFDFYLEELKKDKSAVLYLHYDG